ncbi:MAG TPA: hypothetical protein VKZ50_21570 [bacterium]|nr:hypothetical protein [bacterium]
MRVRLLAGVLAAALVFTACTVRRTPVGLGPPFLRVARVTRVSDAAASSPPTWSPQGRLLAFGTDDAVWQVRPDGTGARRLAALPRVTEVAWAPGGRSLAVVSAGTLYTVGLDGLPPAAVSTAAGVHLVTWAPRDARLAYVVSGGDHDEIATWQAGSDGRRARSVSAPLPPGFAVQTVAWSPDGRDLVLALARQGGAASTRLLRIAVSALHPVAIPFGWRDTMAGPAFDPLGRFVAYVGGSPDAAREVRGQIVAVRLDGTGRRTLTPAGAYTGLSWAPSGTAVAFGEVIAPNETSVEVVDVTTGARLRIADYRPEIVEYARALVTRWAPDGLGLAFGTDTADGRGPVWVATLERR